MAKEKISTIKELHKQLDVDTLDELRDSPLAQAKLIRIAPRLAPSVVGQLLEAVPELSKAFAAMLSAMEGIGKSLDETKRHRWETLRHLAKEGKLTSDQILEAMRIIQEIEKEEIIDWTGIFKTALRVAGAVVVLVKLIAAILPGAGGGKGGGRSA